MPKRSIVVPENSISIRTYSELEAMLKAFAAGHITLLVILGKPGLSKSQSLQKATRGKNVLQVKGRKSPINLYIDLYQHQDAPVILDDADDLMGQKACREMIKALTETDTYKRLEWGTQTTLLANLWRSSGLTAIHLAPSFWTRSICVRCVSDLETVL